MTMKALGRLFGSRSTTDGAQPAGIERPGRLRLSTEGTNLQPVEAPEPERSKARLFELDSFRAHGGAAGVTDTVELLKRADESNMQGRCAWCDHLLSAHSARRDAYSPLRHHSIDLVNLLTCSKQCADKLAGVMHT